MKSFFGRIWKIKTSLVVSTSICTVLGFKWWSNRQFLEERTSGVYRQWLDKSKIEIDIATLPRRDSQLRSLQNNRFDILIIGGGATGSGIALDGATRGLKVGMIEKADFGSGTSGRSTKLIHGGIRYLEKALTRLDRSQWDLVTEAICERAHLIDINPHLSYPIPIIIPTYDSFIFRGWLNLIKFYIGTKIYEAMAGRDGALCPSYFLSASHTRNILPLIKGQNLIGSVVYYDGQHNDARMNLLISLTAAHYGAAITNHVEMVDFIKSETDGKVLGARLRDRLTGEEWNTYASVVINATGAAVDAVRQKDNQHLPKLIIPSQGTHVVLPGTFSPESFGMLIPKTADGRVAFMLPWEGSTVIGTTDGPCHLTETPVPSLDEAQTILNEVNQFLETPTDISDVDAVWSGIRPLCAIPNDYEALELKANPKLSHNRTMTAVQPSDAIWKRKDRNQSDGDDAADTANISRHHLIEVLPSGLVTITGGKWTTYRRMAEDCIDVICALHPDTVGVKATECVTQVVKLVGSARWSPSVSAVLERHRIPTDIAHHLSRNYGDKAFIVADLYLSQYNQPLAGGYPFTESEVIYSARYEMTETAIDFLSNRSRLALLSRSAAEYALPKVIELLSMEHNWDTRECVRQFHESMAFFRTMHVKRTKKWGPQQRHSLQSTRRVVRTVIGYPLTDEAIQFVIERFYDLCDSDTNDFISRRNAASIAAQFGKEFNDDCVTEALLFSGLEKYGLFDILVSCGASACAPQLFDSSIL